MEQAGEGLLQEGLLDWVKECWQSGDMVIAYVKLTQPETELTAALANWEPKRSGLMRRIGFGNSSFYFIQCGSGNPSASLFALACAKELKLLLQEVAASIRGANAERFAHYSIGSLPLLRPQSSIGVEEAVFTQLVGIMKQAESERLMPSESKRQGMKENVSESRGAEAIRTSGRGLRPTIGQLASPVPLFDLREKVSELAYMFEANPEEQGAVIVKEGVPIGLVTKQRLHQLLSGQFGFALYANRSVERIMDAQPLILEEHDPVELAAQLAMSRDHERVYDMLVTVKDGKASGGASVQALLECLAALRTEEARTANPLTGLPGNAGIQSELTRRLAQGENFAVVYADLDYFKWFNDCFGFARGDELIRYLGELMVRCFSRDEHFFVGHVGGDDFIGVVSSEYAEAACLELIDLFDEGARRFHGEAEGLVVEDRQGRPIGRGGVTLSLSLLDCSCGKGFGTEDISLSAAKLKKKAKAITGSSCVSGQLTGRLPSGK